MKAQGELIRKSEAIEVSTAFKKLEFVCKTDLDSMYPQTVLFTLTQERVNLLDKIESGQLVEIDFVLRGKEYQNKEGAVIVINTLDVFKITKK